MFSCFSGYVIGILMMAIIIILGVGITLGYFYKRSVSKSQQGHQSFGAVLEEIYERGANVGHLSGCHYCVVYWMWCFRAFLCLPVSSGTCSVVESFKMRRGDASMISKTHAMACLLMVSWVQSVSCCSHYRTMLSVVPLWCNAAILTPLSRRPQQYMRRNRAGNEKPAVYFKLSYFVSLKENRAWRNLMEKPVRLLQLCNMQNKSPSVVKEGTRIPFGTAQNALTGLWLALQSD